MAIAMDGPEPHLILSYEDRVPAELFDEFLEAVDAEGLDLAIEGRPTPGPFAGVEWLIPPAVVLFITQAYFSGFLGELGKDHYSQFKAAVKRLRERLNLVKVTVISTPGKSAAEQPYSLFYSIYFARDGGTVFKFLVPGSGFAPEMGEEAMEAFFDFLQAYYADSLDAVQEQELASAPQFSRVVLVTYNPELKRVMPIHPITHQFAGVEVAE